MAEYKITNLSFRSLLQRLGIIPYPLEGFSFDTTVIPVSIVDSDIVLTAVSTVESLGIAVVGAEAAAPAAATVLVDTGPLTAGVYTITVAGSADVEAFQHCVQVQHRDAANAANVWTVFQQAGASGNVNYTFRDTLAQNERIRVVQRTAGSAGSIYQFTIWHNID